MDRLVRFREKLLYLYIFSLGFPVIFLIKDAYKYPKRILSLSILLSLFLLKRRRIRLTPITLSLSLYITYALFSFFWAKSTYIYLDWLYAYIYPLMVFYLSGEEFSKKDLDKLIWFFYIVSLFFGIYGIFQKFGMDPFLTFPRTGRFKIIGLSGNPIYFSDLLLPLFIIFFTLSLGKLSSRMRSIYISIVILLGIVIFFTFSRSAWLAILVTLPIILYIRYKKRWRAFVKYLLGIAISLFVILGLFPPIRRRFFSMFYIFNYTVWVRILVWLSSVFIIKDHPLFGVGAGNFAYVYTYYQGKFLISPFGKSFIKYAGFAEKAHNEYIQLFVELGLLGFLLFFLLLMVYFYYVRWALTKVDRFWIYRLSFFGAVVALLIDGIPGFFMRVPTTSGLFWLFFSLTFVGYNIREAKILKPSISQILKWIAIIILFLYLIFVYFNFFASVFKVKAGHVKKDIEMLKYYTEKAIKCMPIKGSALYLLGQIYLEEKRYREAIGFFNKAVKSYDFCNLHYALGAAYFFEHRYKEADRELEKASIYCTDKLRPPTFWSLLWYRRGVCNEFIKKYKDAVEYYRFALRIDPYLLKPYYRLGYIDYITGKKENAKKIFEALVTLIYKDGKVTSEENDILLKISKLDKINIKNKRGK